MKNIFVSGGFDNLRSNDIRFLEEASKLGDLNVLLWSDSVIQNKTHADPEFPQEERKYFLNAVRFVKKVILVDQLISPVEIPHFEGIEPQTLVVFESEDSAPKRDWCTAREIEYQVLTSTDISGYPETKIANAGIISKKVLVTGCFDWFHSGHVRFFEETSRLGDLYVVVGHDENVRLLKGEGHPMHSEDERRYMAGSIRFVKQALVSSGSGWMDAEPEIKKIQPDIYAVNDDGDKPDKREFCEQHGLEYVVLKRTPAEGLPQRTSTDLRGY